MGPFALNRSFSHVLSGLLILGGTVGLYLALVPLRAQWIYGDLRFKSETGDAETLLSRAESAFALYPVNYRLCDWAGSLAWEACQGAAPPDRPYLLDAVATWSRRAVSLNRYPRSIRSTRRKFLEISNPRAALRDWADFVDWQFWDPYNHAVLLELHLKTGNLEGALSELKWVRGTDREARAVELIGAYVDREFKAPFEALQGHHRKK